MSIWADDDEALPYAELAKRYDNVKRWASELLLKNNELEWRLSEDRKDMWVRCLMAWCVGVLMGVLVGWIGS